MQMSTGEHKNEPLCQNKNISMPIRTAECKNKMKF